VTTLISEQLCSSVCEQISHELYNSNLYAYIAAFLKNKGLDNLAAIFNGQREEEFGHSKMFIDFLTDMGAPVKIMEVPACDMTFGSILDIAQAYVDREILTTANIDAIKHLAIDESNPVAEEFLRGMIKIQQAEHEESLSFQDSAQLTEGDWKFVMLWDKSLED
jgi:ferritin